VQQLAGERDWFGEPFGDVAAGGPARHAESVQDRGDLWIGVAAGDQPTG
jgi:hypothetical protein